MRKTLATIAILALLAIPMIAFAGQAQSPVLNGTPEPKGDSIACEEGLVELEASQWVCEWVDTSHFEPFQYEAAFHPAVTEMQCPEGYSEMGLFPEGPRACRATIDGVQVWAAAVEVEIEREYYDCPDGGELARSGNGPVCEGEEWIEDGYWDCGWTQPVCAEPTEVPTPVPTPGIGGVNIDVDCLDDGRAVVYWSFDAGARGRTLVITGQGSEHELEHGKGRFLARPGKYTWIVYEGETPIARGGFTVDVCPLPTEVPPTEVPSTEVPGDCSNTGDNICPGDDDDPKAPKTQPATGADPNTALAVVMSLGGFALAGIGGSILYIRRRASR